MGEEPRLWVEKVPGGRQPLRSSGSEQAVPAPTRSLAPPHCRPESHMCFPVFRFGPRSHPLPFLLLRVNSYWSLSLTPCSLSQRRPLFQRAGSSSLHLSKGLRQVSDGMGGTMGKRESACGRRMERVLKIVCFLASALPSLSPLP